LKDAQLTYHAADVVKENIMCSVACRYIARKRLVNVNKFHV